MTPVKFGIIGCSSIARRRFLPSLLATNSAKLEFVGSRDIVKAEQLAREFNCTKWGTYESVLTDPNIDAVYISTPPALHEQWVRAAAENHKHILCEKPAFLNRATAVDLIEFCRRQNVRLMEGYMFAYHPQHAIVQSQMASGRIGEPRFCQSEFFMPQPAAVSFRLKRELGGGIFVDATGYPVAAAMLLFNAAPISVFCEIETDAADVDSSVSMILHFPENKTAHIRTAYGLHYRSRYSIFGSQGRIEALRAFAVPPEMKTEIIVETDSGTENIIVPPVDQFRLMIEDFCAQISSSNKSWALEEKLLRQHTVMEAARRSHLERRTVLLSEFVV